MTRYFFRGCRGLFRRVGVLAHHVYRVTPVGEYTHPTRKRHADPPAMTRSLHDSNFRDHGVIHFQGMLCNELEITGFGRGKRHDLFERVGPQVSEFAF